MPKSAFIFGCCTGERALSSYRLHFYASCRCLTGHFISVKLYLHRNATPMRARVLVYVCIDVCVCVMCVFTAFFIGVSKLVFPSLQMKNTKAKGIIKQKTHIYEILNRHHICDTKCPKAQHTTAVTNLTITTCIH